MPGSSQRAEVSLYKYAALVKNLRGVLYWIPEAEDKLRWLLSRFKYRNLGVPPSMAARLKLRRKVLVTLAYPSEAIREAVNVFSRILGEAEAEALCLASVYVSPLMLVGAKLDAFKPALVETITTNKELSDKDWKLHMRIADYTVLDFYSWSLDSAVRALFEGKVEDELRVRRERIEADKKRYWRIASKEGRPIVAYFDLLKAAYEQDVLNDLREIGKDSVAVLGIVAGLVI